MDHFERLLEQSQKESLADRWRTGLLEGLKPDTGDYEVYQDDPVGFCEEVLGLTLTEDQKGLLNDVLETPVVQVRSATGVGKTFVLAALAIWVYKAFAEAQVYTASAPPEANLRRLLWGEIFALAKDMPELFKGDNVRASLLIDRHPKQFITGVTIPKDASEDDTETKWSGKHSPVLVFIFDEGDGIPDPVFRGADGCMSGGVFVRQVVCYNPKKKSGEVYRREIERRAKIRPMSALNHPNVLTGEDVIPGAVTRNKTVLRIIEWTEPLPLEKEKELDHTCWRVPEFLVGATAIDDAGVETQPLRPGWRQIIDNQFYYKVLARYPAGSATQLIWDSWIDDAVTRWEAMRAMNGGVIKPPEGVTPIMGFDVADLGPDNHAVTCRYGGWIDIPETWKDIDADLATEKVAILYRDRRPSIIKVDAIGVGAGAPGKLSRKSKDLGIRITAARVMTNEKSKGFTEDGDFKTVRDEACWNVREAFRKGTAAIPPRSHNEACKRLHDALLALTYEEVGGEIQIVSKKILRKQLGYSPGEFDSYMLTYAQQRVWMGGI